MTKGRMTRRAASVPPPGRKGAKLSAAPPPTEERILVAGEALFCAQGFAGVSARDVAERAGVTKALVFYHYGSMRGLFEAVLERYYAAHRRGLADALRGGGTTRERMSRLVDAYLEFMASNARYAALVQAQLANPDTQALVEKSLTPLFHFVEATLLEVAPKEGRAAARQLFVTFSGAVINWCTYAPLLSRVLGGEMLGAELLRERGAHLRWLVDLVLADLERAPSLPARPRGRPGSPRSRAPTSKPR